jgi:hypothetical protein
VKLLVKKIVVHGAVLLIHCGQGHLNCLNARSQGLNNMNQLLCCVSLKIYNNFANYFCVIKCIVRGNQARFKNADLRHPSCTVVMYKRKSVSPVHNVLITVWNTYTYIHARIHTHINTHMYIYTHVHIYHTYTCSKA